MKLTPIFLIVVVLTLSVSTAFAGTDTKNAMLQMTTTLENSETQLQWNYAENIGDGRGITFGCIGFCTGTYDGNILIKHYTKLNPDNTLAKYIPALNKIDAGRHRGDGNPSTKGLNGFIKDVQKCKDPLFKQAQLYELDKLYYNPAMGIADSIGAKNALTKAFIYDMCVRHGPDDARKIVNRAGKTPKQGVNENTYLSKLISLRDAKLKSEGLGDVNRDAGYKKLLKSGNVNLKTPFTFVAYGDKFTIDGDLGIDSEEVPDPDNSQTVTIAQDNFENGVSDYWFRAMNDYSYSGNPSTNCAVSPACSYRFELHSTDKDVEDGKRAELEGQPEPRLQERIYKFSTYLPNGGAEDYAIDSYPSEEIIAQWHNNPDPGEEWTMPPLALMTTTNKQGSGRYTLGRIWDDNPKSTDEQLIADGKLTHYDLGSYEGDKGKWIKWTFHVKWGWLESQNPKLEVYKDGVLILNLDGLPNTMNDREGVNQQFGIYKWEWDGGDISKLTKRVIYFDDVSVLQVDTH